MYPHEPVVIVIHGIRFLVDVWTRELIEEADPLNRLNFYSWQLTDSGYSFGFDLKEKDIPYGYDPDFSFDEQQLGPGVVKVDIPFFVQMDPEGMRKKYAIPFGTILPERDEDFHCRPDLLKKRLDGQLPEITIAGTPYIIDVCCGELRYYEQRHSVIIPHIIKLDICDESEDGKEVFILYDKRRHQQITFDPELIAIPPDLVVIAIPAPHWLDPVGMARRESVNDTAYVDRYPFQESLAYRTVPLEQTFLPTLVKENRQKRGLTVSQGNTPVRGKMNKRPKR